MARSRFKQVVDGLVSDIQSGNLRPGTRLPTHRELARRHDLALATASRVYAELARMGLVIGEIGRGTYVREAFGAQGMACDMLAGLGSGIDLNANMPTAFGQDTQLRRALRHLSQQGDLEALLLYQPPLGRPQERQLVADYLVQRGVPTDAGRVALVQGAQHGLTVALLGALCPGDAIAVDALTYPGFRQIAAMLRMEMIPVPVGREGTDLQALRTLCSQRRVKAVYCMPTMHNPLGFVLTLQQRQELAAIARQHGLLVLEDAAYAYLAAPAVVPVAALAPERTVYIGGLSKNLATGLRFGYISAPPAMMGAIERAIRATTVNSPALVTALVRRWLMDGTVDRMERHRRADARHRQALARRLLEGVTLVGHPGSYLLWLPLEGRDRAEAICQDLHEQGIALSTAAPFAVGTHVPNALRIALGTVDPSTLERALAQVRIRLDQLAG
ncbi:PLP-dependent aminotransferase family protein [Stenotrophomonas maltophilia]|uniref:aminotransferase-like domain-containing protein n=1 Tax=Stenotrophomonas maltophilia TaxID=40324 RepID=UPI0013113665|nr:PLP-dependent aminotransferase family protein [Stenotrophomonas maltophilia]